MATSESIGGDPVVVAAPQDGDTLVYVAAQQRWINVQPAPGGGGGAPQYAGNLRRQEIDDLLLGTEVKLGGFTLDPTLFTGATFSLSLTATLTDAGGVAPTFTLRLYDMGAPNTPIAPVLRSDIVLSVTGVLRFEEQALGLVGSPGVNADDIHNVIRTYEVRGELNGDVGDLVEIDFAGVLGT